MWNAPNEYEFGKTKGYKRKTFDQVTAIQMERSPTKWKTMYRDQFRKFTESPGRELNQNDEDDVRGSQENE